MTKKTIYLSDQSVETIKHLTRTNGDRIMYSNGINLMSECFKEILNEKLPNLSDDEWNAFYCAYNGRIPHQKMQEELRIMSWSISEGFKYDSQIRDFLKNDPTELLDKISTWGFTEKLSVFIKAQAYWSR